MKRVSDFAALYPFVAIREWNVTVNYDSAALDTTVKCRDYDHAVEMKNEMDRIMLKRGLRKSG